MCRMSWNLRASTSWNPQGLPRAVQGLIYLLFTFTVTVNVNGLTKCSCVSCKKTQWVWPQVKHRLTNRLQHLLQRCRTVDTGGQEAFVTEGTEKEAIWLQFPLSVFYEIKFCATHPLFLTEQKLRVTVPSTPSGAFHAFLTFSSSFSSVSVGEQFKKKAIRKMGSWESAIS